MDWEPIGNKENPFNGNFNGKGFNISNLSVSKNNVEHLGLFGVLGKNSVVRNLQLEDFNVNNQKELATCNFQQNYSHEKEVGPHQIHCSPVVSQDFHRG